MFHGVLRQPQGIDRHAHQDSFPFPHHPRSSSLARGLSSLFAGIEDAERGPTAADWERLIGRARPDWSSVARNRSLARFGVIDGDRSPPPTRSDISTSDNE